MDEQTNEQSRKNARFSSRELYPLRNREVGGARDTFVKNAGGVFFFLFENRAAAEKELSQKVLTYYQAFVIASGPLLSKSHPRPSPASLDLLRADSDRCFP